MIDLKDIPNSAADVSSSNYEYDSNDKAKFFNNGFYDSYYIRKSSRIPTPPPTASSNFYCVVNSTGSSPNNNNPHKNLVSDIFSKINQPDFKQETCRVPFAKPVIVEENSFSTTRSIKILPTQKRRINDEDNHGNTNAEDIHVENISQITTTSKVKSLRRLKSIFSFMHKSKPELKTEKDQDEEFCNSSFSSFNNNNDANNTSKFDAISFSTDCEAKLKYCWPSTSECLSGTTLTQSKENNRFDVNDYSNSIISVSSGISSQRSPKRSKQTLCSSNDNDENIIHQEFDDLKDTVTKSSSLSFRNFFSVHKNRMRKNITKDQPRRKKHFRDLFRFTYKNDEETHRDPFNLVEPNDLSTNLESTKRKSIRKKISSYFYNNSNFCSVSILENDNDNTTVNSSWNPENLDNPYDIAANNSRISLKDIIPENLLKDVNNNNELRLSEKLVEDNHNEKDFLNDKALNSGGHIIKSEMIFKSPFDCEISDVSKYDNNESFKRKIEINKLVFELDNFNVNKHQHHNGSRQNDNERSSSAMFFRSPNFEVEERDVQRVRNNYSNRISISKF